MLAQYKRCAFFLQGPQESLTCAFAAVVSENAMLPHMSQTQLPMAGHIPVPGMGAQLAPYMAAQQLPQAALVPMPLQTLHLGHPMFQQMPQIGGPPEGGLPTAMWSVPRAVGAMTSGGVFPAMPPAPVGIHSMGLQVRFCRKEL